jgi:hypothetical protein
MLALQQRQSLQGARVDTLTNSAANTAIAGSAGRPMSNDALRPDQTKAAEQDTQIAKSLPVPAMAPTPPTATQPSVSFVSGGNAYRMQAPPPASAQTVEVQGASPRSAELKSPPAVAVAGSLRKAEIASTGIVRWTISAAGRLERILQNGATATVEPAAGMTVRAVAFQSIEVWAAGEQADASAKQWIQRHVLFHSSDAGQTWKKVDGPWQTPITRLDLAGSRDLTVVSEDGTWTTTDGGENWTKK